MGCNKNLGQKDLRVWVKNYWVKKIGAQENSGQEIILNLEILLVRNCFDLTKIVGTRKLWVQNKFFGRFYNLNAKNSFKGV